MAIPVETIINHAKATGFDAELTVAAILRKAGWSARQSVYYVDKDEGKGRELDVLAYKNFTSVASKPEATCGIFFCIEVKRTADAFLFFSDNVGKFEYGAGYGIFHWKNKVNNKILPYKNIEKHRPLNKTSRIARSYSSFKSGNDKKGGSESHIKSAVISAFKAAVHWSEGADERYSDTSHDICFFIPIVVVDGDIYDCFFPEGEGDLTAEQVDKLVYMQNYQSSNYGDISAQIIVVSIDSLKELLTSFTTWGQSMLATMVENRGSYD